MALISSIEDIKSELQIIQKFLESEINIDVVGEIDERGSILSQHMARSGKLLADAKYYQDESISKEVVSQLESLTQLKPMAQKKFLDSASKDLNYLVNLADRINRSCTHQLDWCRSLLSKQKEELRHNYR